MVRVKSRWLVLAFLGVAAGVAAVLAWGLHEPALYRVTILPSLGIWPTEATSLNDVGQVVGVAHVDDEKERLFLWDPKSGIQDLGPVYGDPLIIDNDGRICGTMPDANGPQAFIWRPGKGRTRLDTLGGAHSVALAMNNRGQIVGLSYNTNGTPVAFVWDEAGGTKESKAVDEGHYWPQSINDAGQILAKSVRLPLKSAPWFLLDPNGVIALDGVPPEVELRSVNSSSLMAGVDDPDGPAPRIVLWRRQGTPRYVASVSILASLTRINDKGQIAYTDFRGGDRPQNPAKTSGKPDEIEAVSYLWDPAGGRVPLNDQVPGIKSLVVVDLNNKGALVGTAEMADGTMRAVLLEPK